MSDKPTSCPACGETRLLLEDDKAIAFVCHTQYYLRSNGAWKRVVGCEHVTFDNYVALRAELAQAREELAETKADRDAHLGIQSATHECLVDKYRASAKDALAQLSTARAHVAALVEMSSRWTEHNRNCSTRYSRTETDSVIICNCGLDLMQSAARAARE